MIYLLVFLIAFSLLLTSLTTVWIRKVALRISFVDLPGDRKIHTAPVPLGGGVAVAVGIFGAILVGVMGAYLQGQTGLLDFLPKEIIQHVEGVFVKLPQLVVICMGGLVILVLGLVDDRYGVSPWTKLLVQALVALGLVLSGEQLSVFLGGSLSEKALGAILTVCWVIIVTNGFNLMDHMDGVCCGVIVITSLSFLIVALFTQQLFIACLLATLIGANLGFLSFNFHPARIFLGDAGSMFLGYLAAALTIVFTFYQEHYELYSYFTPLVVLSIPLFDSLTVAGIRLARGRHIFQADTNHLAHRLVYLGMPIQLAVLVVYILTLCTGLGAILLYKVDNLGGAVIILSQILLIFGIIILIQLGSYKR
jgi:UDP-GlcNAc:undecaprenyl-phosphate GlcNAc-1-phosphate transferase